ELFNITSLIEQGYDDRHMNSIPLIISFHEQTSLNASAAPLSQIVSENHLFSSIDAMAAKVDKARTDVFMNALFTTKEFALKSTEILDNDIKHIRLDRQVEADLEESVPQI